MARVDILLTSELDGGMEPFNHDYLELRFHRWTGIDTLPLIEGALWAFVDWTLPASSGLAVCGKLRGEAATAHARIVMVLDEDRPEIRRQAEDCGADECIAGPITRTSVLDRVLVSQAYALDHAEARQINHGDLTIDLGAFQARWKGTPLSLMPNEFRLLRYFAEHPNRVFSRAQLIAALGKQQPAISERTVDVWIGRIRKALRKCGAGNPLRTVHLVGYVFDTP